MSGPEVPIRLVSLHLYPVKSAHRIDVADATLGARGLQGDREWLVTDAAGRFLTQRTHPALARLRPDWRDGQLRLQFPGLPPLELPVAGDSTWERRRVRIWDDDVEAASAGPSARAWLRAALGLDADLVRAGEFTQRQPAPRWTGGRDAPVNFSDGFPLLVAARASLEELNSRLPRPLPMTRFRPNLVIEGLPPYAEDSVDELVFDRVALRLVKPCTRCATTHVDQELGEVADGPIEVLKGYRYDRALRGVTFGQNAIIVEGIGQRLAAGISGVARYREVG